MSRLSRREFGIASLATAVAASLPAVSEGQSAPPVSDELKKLLDAARQGNAQSTKMRQSYKLTEGSEPCTVFHAWEPKSHV